MQQPGIPGLTCGPDVLPAVHDLSDPDGRDAGSAAPVPELLTGRGLAALMTLPGVGSKRAVDLARRFCTWQRFLAASEHEVAAAVGASTAGRVVAARSATIPHHDLPHGIQVVSIYEEHYPARLRAIPDPPPVLWWQGRLPTQPAIAVVGTRSPTPFGQQVALLSAQVAAEHGLPVISGLALGVDSLSHSAGLDHGQPTWAVLGQGIATFPTRGDRAALARRILTSGGGLMCEVPPTTPLAVHMLTRRNRIQSGLSEAVVIAETGLPTSTKPAGTIHTARFAIEQGRTLAVAAPPPGREDDSALCGNAALTATGGIDPALLHVTDPALAAQIRERRPAADVIVARPEDLHALCAAIASDHT